MQYPQRVGNCDIPKQAWQFCGIPKQAWQFCGIPK
jgi:hypothetical protein